MGRRLQQLRLARKHVLPRWITILLLVVMWLLVALGIYIGLHSRVLGPDY
jgi:uncharacterized membrane protein